MVNSWTPGVTLDQLERNAIEQAFKFYRGNKTQTSIALGIAIRTLETKLERYAADDKRTHDANERERGQRESFLKRQRGIHTEQSSIDTANGAASKEMEPDSRTETPARIRVESPQALSEKSSMPLQVRKEVQEMPSSDSSAGRARKAR